MESAFAKTPAWHFVLEKIPLLLLSIACSVAAVLSQGSNIVSLEKVTISARFANALVSYVVYLRQFFWPVGLAVFYPRPESVPAWQVVVAFFVLAVFSAVALMSWRRQPAVLVGWFWYLGMLLPTIGLVAIGDHVRADRYTYLPHIGLCIALVWGVRSGMERLLHNRDPQRWLCSGGGMLLVSAFMACAWRQTSYWQNSERLWNHALACGYESSLAHSNLGTALATSGRTDEAIAQFGKALDVNPDYAAAYFNLGLALGGRGQVDAAIAQYRQALEKQPYSPKPTTTSASPWPASDRPRRPSPITARPWRSSPTSCQAHNSLGQALAGRGQVNEAIDHYRQAIEIEPDDVQAHNNLGITLADRGQVNEAVALFRRALEIRPGDVDAHNNLGLALAGRGEIDDAIAHFRKALEIKPDDINAHANLGKALAGRGQADEAFAHYRRH